MRILIFCLLLIAGNVVFAQKRGEIELSNISKGKKIQKDSTSITISIIVNDTTFQDLELKYGDVENSANLVYMKLKKEVDTNGEVFLTYGDRRYKIENNIVNIPAIISADDAKRMKFLTITSKRGDDIKIRKFTK